MIQTKSSIVSNEQLNDDCWRLRLDSPEIASEIKPGQFIMLKIDETNDPLFRRPFSVFKRGKVGRGSRRIDVVYRVVGRGTERMTGLRRGDKVDLLGPLGHGFEFVQDKPAHVILAGGTGLACLFMLAEEISKKAGKNGAEFTVLLGATTKRNLILEEEYAALAGKVMVSTDDGTYGYHGFVTDMLKDGLDRGKITSNCAIYASGPEPMFKALAPICQQYHIPAQISMERHMMCGVGGCFVCVCKVDGKGVRRYRDLPSSHIQLTPEEWGYALVCKDGPVFRIDEVIL
jgi:dihydroorotate dehydrogenase electron transfer subunit